MPEALLYPNGINGATGQYLLEPLTPSALASIARRERQDGGQATWLARVADWLQKPHLGLPLGVDPTDPAQAGWGLIVHEGEPQANRDALAPLVEHRGGRVLEYKAGEKRRDWLARHGVGQGSVVPSKVPYYLLLLGSPAAIPYEFQYLLDVEYAVGRLELESADTYRRYAESVIAYDGATTASNARTAVFFGTRHSFDQATMLSADHLVSALAGVKPGTTSVAEPYDFATRPLIGEPATKESLSQLLASGGRPPAFCFTATHGLGWPTEHPKQLDEQGALVCQEWKKFGQLDADQYFSAADVPDDARVFGMVTFHFACYGAGTPEHDNFSHVPGEPPPAIAAQPFVAKLPKRLLGHPNGSALATIGHVERAWGSSIVTGGAGPQLLPFANTIGAVLDGLPVGYATKDFNERYAVLSVDLSSLLEEIGNGAQVPDQELAQAWIERNDAQNYVILGDPAVRLRAEALGEE